MKLTYVIAAVLSSLVLGMTACASPADGTPTHDKITYEQISQEQAKALMDSEQNRIILDTRTEEEYAEGHIAGAVCISYDEILQKAEGILPDKSQLILVYCRSGRRSKLAAEDLCSLGYTNVKEFGGIIDWIYGVTS